MQFDLKELFKDGYCNFEIAKRLAKTGIKPDKFDLSYNTEGSLGDGGWTAEITGHTFYPAVDFYQAIMLLEEVVDAEPIMSTDGEQFYITVGEKKTAAQNRTDAICLMFLKYAE